MSAASRYPEHLLEEIRARLPVSDVALRLVGSLKRVGSEYVGLSPFNKEKTPSFTVNNRKRLWKDFSSGKGGDVFGLECEVTGCSFPEAVAKLAEQAGVALPAKPNGKGNGHAYEQRSRGDVDSGNAERFEPEPSGLSNDDLREAPEPPPEEGAPSRPRLATKQEARKAALQTEPTAIYVYRDAEGDRLYEKLRFEFEFNGERGKTFVQRRALDNGEWAYSLAAGPYFRTADGRWFPAKNGRGELELAEAERVPYNLPALLAAIEIGDPIFAVEGEKDAETLIGQGLTATCSVGGRWPELAGYFSRADVIQMLDNDDAGERYEQELGFALKGHASSHRVLRFPELRPGGDVTDWYEAGGTTEKLFERIELEAKPWSPLCPPTEFGAVHFHAIGAKKPERNWQIKNLLLSSAFALVYGPPACGKSFLVTDLLLTLAWATINPVDAGEWFGHRIRKPTGVVYIASEAPEDFEIRLHAWRLRNEIKPDVELPFVFLPTTVDMATDRRETARLVEELKRLDVYFQVKFGFGVGVCAIDTVSRALAGGNENAPDVMGSFIKNAETLRDGVGKMTVIAVHHSPIDGTRPRGHTSLHGAADLEIEVRKPEKGNPNQWVIRKFKAGPEGVEHSFRLEPIVVGQDAEHEPITSCVIAGRMAADAARLARQKPKGQVHANQNEIEFLRALSTAIERQGVMPPASITAPQNIDLVVDARYVRELYMEHVQLSEDGESTTAVQARFRARWKRATEAMRKFNVVGSQSVENGEKDDEGRPRKTTYVWFTGRPVSGNVTLRGVRVTETEKPVTESSACPDEPGHGHANAGHGSPETSNDSGEFPI